MIPLLCKWARRIAQSTLTLLLPATAAFAVERIPWTTSRVVGSPEPPSLARVERVFAGLTFRQPLDLQHEPRGKRWWVAQETGQLLSFPDQGDPSRSWSNSADAAARLHRQGDAFPRPIAPPPCGNQPPHPDAAPTISPRS